MPNAYDGHLLQFLMPQRYQCLAIDLILYIIAVSTQSYLDTCKQNVSPTNEAITILR